MSTLGRPSAHHTTPHHHPHHHALLCSTPHHTPHHTHTRTHHTHTLRANAQGLADLGEVAGEGDQSLGGARERDEADLLVRVVLLQVLRHVQHPYHPPHDMGWD